MGRLIDAEVLKEYYSCWDVTEDGKKVKRIFDEIVDRQPSVNDSGTYQCAHCLSYSVIWDSDFDFEDFGYEGEGIIHICHCTNCGAEIEYRIPIVGEEKDEIN